MKKSYRYLIYLIVLIIGLVVFLYTMRPNNESSKPEYESNVPGELTVFFEEGVTEEGAIMLFEQYEEIIKISSYYRIGRWILIKVPEGEESQYIDNLKKDPRVRRVIRSAYIDFEI